MNLDLLVEAALKVRSFSYSPYSKFRVGAAFLTSEDEIITGVNIENVTYGAVCCAERTAIYNAVSKGVKTFKAAAIASDSDDYTFPCGICRQVILEFCDEDFIIACANKYGKYKVFKLKELLPHSFSKEQLINAEGDKNEV